MRVVALAPDGIAVAADRIRNGEVVAYPTETVYGLGVDPFSEAAVKRLFECKGRDAANPILLIVADDTQLRAVVRDVSEAAMKLMRAFWPGPLSLLFPKADGLPDALTAGQEEVCVRCTSHPVARDLCLAVGHAITSSSANRAGQPAARSPSDLDLPGIACAIDGGTLQPSAPSTVFDPDTWKIVREGAVSAAQLAAVLPRPPAVP